ncbi:MAG: hypothetical protein KatS3mg062_1218 [Tepidiforma sp.]|nr:MAG: hypothetical protein KatS3mg062_1218 [Tepidiforma sp.]
MLLSRLFQPRRLAFAALLVVCTASAYGLAAANTVPASRAGDGSAAVSGYTITNVHYTLDAFNPQQLSSVTFNISPAVPTGGTVRVSTDGGATWSAPCGTGSSITCPTTASVASVTGLRVVAAQ